MIVDEIARWERIALRPTREADLDHVLEMEREPDNADFIRQWTIERHRAACVDSNIAHWIIETISDNRIVGYVILVGLLDFDRNIEFKRIVINEKAEGLGKESVQLIKKVAFENLGAHRLWLEVMEHNVRAFRLYESEGFVLEGVHRESLKQGDKFVSLKVMSILAHEYVHQKQ